MGLVGCGGGCGCGLIKSRLWVWWVVVEVLGVG